MKSSNFTPPFRTQVPAPSTALNVLGSQASCMLTFTSVDAFADAAKALEVSAIDTSETPDGPDRFADCESGPSPQPTRHDSAAQPTNARINMTRSSLVHATTQARHHPPSLKYLSDCASGYSAVLRKIGELLSRRVTRERGTSGVSVSRRSGTSG